MKLVEILAKELKAWPAGCAVVTQNEDSVTVRLKSTDVIFSCGIWTGADGKSIIGFADGSALASDYKTAIVTRKDWEKEKMKQATPKKNAEGWIRHRGGKCPVDPETIVEVRLRDGTCWVDSEAETGSFWTWQHSDICADIMAYRPHKSAEQVEACSKPELQINLKDSYGEIYNAQAIPHGPLKWRDRIAEIDATTQALTTERAELVQKLASEGFALIGRVVEQVEDMSDWRNWKAGDLIEMVREKSWADMTDGRLYPLIKAGVNGFSFVDDVGEVRECFERTAEHYAEDFKWHSRPSA